MNAEILAVGTELLLGDILNTNAQFLAKELAALGIPVFYQSVVGDNSDRLFKALETAFARADMVIATGGLGPTKDDLTKEIGGRFFGKKMVEDQSAMATLKSYFTSSGRNMTENNLKQAFIPEGSIMIPNHNGTAPGCLIEDKGKILIMLPGPPSEMKPMFNDFVLPYLQKKTNQQYISKTVRICGIGESAAEEMIKDLIENQTNPTIAPYAKETEVLFRITASAANEEEGAKLMKPILTELYNRFGQNIYGEGDTSLAETVIAMLEKENLKIAVAESCTGGLLSSSFVALPGVSKIFLEGVVTYSDDAKVKRLGVNAETLKVYGAVSEETAAEMAKGIAQTSGADIGIATTGIAGPDGGTDEKPVGLVYISLYYGGKVIVKKFNLKGDRTKIRLRTAANALDMLRRGLLNE